MFLRMSFPMILDGDSLDGLLASMCIYLLSSIVYLIDSVSSGSCVSGRLRSGSLSSCLVQSPARMRYGQEMSAAITSFPGTGTQLGRRSIGASTKWPTLDGLSSLASCPRKPEDE